MRRIGDTAIAVVSTASLGVAVWLLAGPAVTHAPPQPTAAEGRPDPGEERLSAPALTASPPTRVRIPAIRVAAPLTGLTLNSSGGLNAPPPADKNLAGWYRAGTTPGETGTAIIAGHVDNTKGPAVFYDLGALKRGAVIEVDREDGRTALFTVDAVEVYSARDFPDDKVYSPAPRPELRVITCGGGYSKTTGYQGNVVVFAHLTGSRPATGH
ncbi:class F sortase [Streptomyces sp. J2-1]|uniref:class F sortase n=1 Tax=Streptomyces corallincola TaxID=2851888 RepID=UPI001C3935B9|nr:class F sortase [Streptomyces corallincola]MBV2357515.1 class F sortase [Streptomyces corallincola]